MFPNKNTTLTYQKIGPPKTDMLPMLNYSVTSILQNVSTKHTLNIWSKPHKLTRVLQCNHQRSRDSKRTHQIYYINTKVKIHVDICNLYYFNVTMDCYDYTRLNIDMISTENIE